MIATFFTYYTEPFCLPVCFTNERQLLFMKGKIKLLMVLAAINPLSVNAQGIADIIATLDSMKCYHAEARFTVTMPQLPRDVVYNTILTAQNTAGDDPLAPCQARPKASQPISTDITTATVHNGYRNITWNGIPSRSNHGDASQRVCSRRRNSPLSCRGLSHRALNR